MASRATPEADGLWREAETGTVTSAQLQKFLSTIEAGTQSPAGDADDVEWFRLYAAVAAKLEASNNAQEFGLPDGNWRDLNVQFDKIEAFYDGLRQTDAVRSVSWYQGGHADIRATDLRPIHQHLARQVKLRLRMMRLAPSQEEPAASQAASDELSTAGPGWLRKMAIRVGEQAILTIVIVLVGGLVTFFLVRAGLAQ